ncbi:alpha/beta-hydrolase [Conidiobolus coronatus NRRL 28638]|uniref:Alpha/beta-hydrolase n=1 Tax=Conidiobolus coronatus (strain ATCC 28846 / CBS 209.66 / NRRL 28638) TaxID=796925 RepID=A0A137PI25_CONC2|nr:alpha/beta-hydrolase [Conidiobolus coronatus NRRL 28638]|eukprot:KXN74601.1 alpha/beta-hydrolase [Conidiobolus coronatus NRRL 28638]
MKVLYLLTLFFNLISCFTLRQVNFIPKDRPSPSDSSLFNNLTISARYSALSYCPSIALKYWKCGTLCSDKYYKLDIITYYQEIISGSTVFLGYHNSSNTIVISYRGSRNIQNWINNININLIQVEEWEGKVHEGFYSIYKGLRHRVLNGHSLGGALASYLNLDVINLLNTKLSNFTTPVSLNTFGSPRIGDGKFSDYYYEKVFDYNTKKGLNLGLLRVVNNNDIVPNLPYLSNGFVHIPHQLWYKPVKDGNSKNLTECNDLPYTNAVGKNSSLKEDLNCTTKQIAWNWQDHLSFGDITFGMPCI